LLYAFLLLAISLLPPDSLNFVNSFGKFHSAQAISTSREEFIFVTDIQTNQIHKFNSEGKEILTFGGSGFSNNELNIPMAIDASNGLDVYVCDYQNNRIQRYDLLLNFIATFNFNTYNLTADNSRKIYYPYGIAFLNTSEIFVLADASTYKVVKLKSLDEVSLLFGSNSAEYQKILNPQKVVRGANLDVWILDKDADALLNYDNYGTFVQKLENPETSPIISMAYYKNNLYILNSKSLIIYDLKKDQYGGYYSYKIKSSDDIMDIAAFKEDTVLILTTGKVYKYSLSK
jgi:hypothetical protein